MPQEHKKRGRREEKKRKREQEEFEGPWKRQKSEDAQDAIKFYDGEAGQEDAYAPYSGPGELPFYGSLGEDEQEYFKRADSMLELNQFADSEEGGLFLANVYKEAKGKELKIANSQSCSRLMERLILLSTPGQLKMLFQTFSGHFLNLVQHRFASHCCEALFLKAAPFVTSELITPPESEELENDSEVYVSMENLFLFTCNELEGNLGYLMTDRFASHPLRVLLVVLSGMPLAATNSTSVMQSKKKENITIHEGDKPLKKIDADVRPVPAAFQTALDKMIAGTVVGLDTTTLRVLASHPIANPVLQLLIELELKRSGKKNARDTNSLFRKFLPDEPLVEGTESASFVNNLAYDTIGSRLLETIVTHAPGKTFKALCKCSFGDRLGTWAKNEIAAFPVIRVLERLNRDDLQTAVDQICPQIGNLIERSRTNVIKMLIDRCRVRQIDTKAIVNELEQAYGIEASGRLIKMLKVNAIAIDGMAEDRRKQLENHDSSMVHGSLLAQCMLEASGPLREFITDALLAVNISRLIHIAKDRTASRVLQLALTCQEQNPKFHRTFIPRLYGHIGDLAADTVGSHVVDSLWGASASLRFIREGIADEIARNESSLRTSIPGRAVWRNWKMDMYKSRRKDWLNESKGSEANVKSGIELARERFAASTTNGQHRNTKVKIQNSTRANNISI